METFIIVYMIANEVAGVAMAVGYIKYLISIDYFTQRKIAKWRKSHPVTDGDFWGAYHILEKALQDAQAKGQKELTIIAWTTLDGAYSELSNYAACVFRGIPNTVAEKLYQPAFKELLNRYDVSIKKIY